MDKYLDYEGLETLVSLIKSTFATQDTVGDISEMEVPQASDIVDAINIVNGSIPTLTYATNQEIDNLFVEEVVNNE